MKQRRERWSGVVCARWVEILLLCFGLSVGTPVSAQQVSVFGSVGAGISHTSEGDDPGIPLLGPGVGGTATAVAADVGVWFTRAVGLAGEFSFGFPFQVEQTEGGVGLCCSELTRDHRVTYLSAVVKARLDPGVVFLGGLSQAQISTSEVRVSTPIGGTPRPPVESEFSKTRAAWVVGAEGEIPVSRSLLLVPAVRFFVNFPKDGIQGLNPLALGNTTFRIMLSLRGTSGR